MEEGQVVDPLSTPLTHPCKYYLSIVTVSLLQSHHFIVLSHASPLSIFVLGLSDLQRPRVWAGCCAQNLNGGRYMVMPYIWRWAIYDDALYLVVGSITKLRKIHKQVILGSFPKLTNE